MYSWGSLRLTIVDRLVGELTVRYIVDAVQVTCALLIEHVLTLSAHYFQRI